MIILSEPKRLHDIEILVSFDSEKAIDKTEPDQRRQEQIKAALDDCADRLAKALGSGLV